MPADSVKLESSWLHLLQKEFSRPYFSELRNFLKTEKAGGKVIYPPGGEIFAALDATPFDKVKVVLLGQDPYHGPGQAHGLCFSVRAGIQPPPSLLNIFRELESDLNQASPESGDLTKWARQGVLLLNAVLSVEHGQAGSHQNKGWEQFTDAIIHQLSAKRENLVFLLWGGYARKKGAHIDRSKHLVLECGHPSPLSANRGHWFGNRHFSKTNHYLRNHGISPVDWSL